MIISYQLVKSDPFLLSSETTFRDVLSLLRMITPINEPHNTTGNLNSGTKLSQRK